MLCTSMVFADCRNLKIFLRVRVCFLARVGRVEGQPQAFLTEAWGNRGKKSTLYQAHKYVMVNDGCGKEKSMKKI